MEVVEVSQPDDTFELEGARLQLQAFSSTIFCGTNLVGVLPHGQSSGTTIASFGLATQPGFDLQQQPHLLLAAEPDGAALQLRLERVCAPVSPHLQPMQGFDEAAIASTRIEFGELLLAPLTAFCGAAVIVLPAAYGLQLRPV